MTPVVYPWSAVAASVLTASTPTATAVPAVHVPATASSAPPATPGPTRTFRSFSVAGSSAPRRVADDDVGTDVAAPTRTLGVIDEEEEEEAITPASPAAPTAPAAPAPASPAAETASALATVARLRGELHLERRVRAADNATLREKLREAVHENELELSVQRAQLARDHEAELAALRAQIAALRDKKVRGKENVQQA